MSVDKSSDFCLYRIRRPYFPEDLPLPIARFRILLGNLYAKKFFDFSGNPLLFCQMCAIILALHRGIAQLVEYRSPKPWVAGSNPPAPAMLCGQNRSAQGKQPFGKPNGGKTGDFERFLPFFSSLLFFLKKYRSIFQTIRNTVNCSTANPKTKPNCLKPFRMSRKNCLKSSAPQKSS